MCVFVCVCISFTVRDRKQAVLFAVGCIILYVCSYSSALLRSSALWCIVGHDSDGACSAE